MQGVWAGGSQHNPPVDSMQPSPIYLADEIMQEPDPELAPQPVSHDADAVLPPSLKPALLRGPFFRPRSSAIPSRGSGFHGASPDDRTLSRVDGCGSAAAQGKARQAKWAPQGHSRRRAQARGRV